GDDVPGEIEGALADLVRPMVAPIVWNRVDDAAGDRMLARERAEHPFAQKQCLVRLKRRGHGAIVLTAYNPLRVEAMAVGGTGRVGMALLPAGQSRMRRFDVEHPGCGELARSRRSG